MCAKYTHKNLENVQLLSDWPDIVKGMVSGEKMSMMIEQWPKLA